MLDPYYSPQPLLVLDRLGNVAEDFDGEVPVKMSGAARVAGRAPEVFRVVSGRATLPVLTTIAETVTFELDESAIQPVVKDVRDDKTDTNYLIMTYESKNVITVKSTGTGDIDALHQIQRFGNADDDTAIIADEDSVAPAAGDDSAGDDVD